jgi:hypothetical protein
VSVHCRGCVPGYPLVAERKDCPGLKPEDREALACLFRMAYRRWRQRCDEKCPSDLNGGAIHLEECANDQDVIARARRLLKEEL